MRKIYCEHCKKELNTLPLKEAIKSKKWWKYELRDFGWGNLLIIIAIILLFSSIYFEFGPKIKDPCNWCKVSVNIPNEQRETKTCTEWMEERYGILDIEEDFNLNEVDNGDIRDMYTK